VATGRKLAPRGKPIVPDFHLAGGGMLTALPVTAGHSNIRLPPAA